MANNIFENYVQSEECGVLKRGKQMANNVNKQRADGRIWEASSSRSCRWNWSCSCSWRWSWSWSWVTAIGMMLRKERGTMRQHNLNAQCELYDSALLCRKNRMRQCTMVRFYLYASCIFSHSARFLFSIFSSLFVFFLSLFVPFCALIAFVSIRLVRTKTNCRKYANAWCSLSDIVWELGSAMPTDCSSERICLARGRGGRLGVGIGRCSCTWHSFALQKRVS